MMSEEGKAGSQQEHARLVAKLGSSQDPDVRGALSLRIAQIEAKFPEFTIPPEAFAVEAVTPEEAPEESPPPPPPTEAEKAEAEALVRLARVEKMRGNAAAATKALRDAAAVAPGAADVLEALGDDLMERKQAEEALKVYRQAVQIAQGNVGLERKYAMAVMRKTPTMSVEDQLRIGLSDSAFLNETDAVAGGIWPIVLSAIIPGLGQIVVGQTKKGFAILGIWFFCVLAIAWLGSDLQQLLRFATGQPAKPSLLVLLPMFGALICVIVSVAGLKPGNGRRRTPVDRPRPPVDMPFE